MKVLVIVEHDNIEIKPSTLNCVSAAKLISDDIEQIDSISRKLFLLNEKRKLIESQIFEEAKDQASQQADEKFIILEFKKGILVSRLFAIAALSTFTNISSIK